MTDFKINNISPLLQKSVSVLTILLGWSLYNILGGIFSSFEYYRYIVQGLNFYYQLLNSIIATLSGILLIFFLIDFLNSKYFLFRHRIEFIILLIFQVIYQLLRPISILYFSILFVNYQLFDIINIIISILIALFNIIFNSYLIKKLYYESIILNRIFFAMLFIIFTVFSLHELLYLFINSFEDHLFYFIQISSFELVYITSAYFCLRIYQKLRIKGSLKLIIPTYIKIALFMFGFIGLVNIGLMLVHDQLLFYGGILIGEMPIIWSIMYYFGLIMYSIFPININLSI